MNTGRRTGTNRRKRTAGLAVIVLVILLLLAGTYAWFHMISALNEFENSEEKSVVLHDDYDKEQVDEEESGDNVWNKDVYVENTGTAEVFVRIRLDEYMELYGESMVDEAEKDDKSTWTPHVYEATEPEECEKDFHEYWEWKLGGSLDKYTPAPESKKNGMVDRYENGVDHLDPNDTDNKSTLAGNTMLMSVYVTKTEAEKEAYIGWILDEADGYAYWSQKLKGGEATGLLLDSVILKAGSQGSYYFDYYYGINVVMEALDETDLFAWLEGKEPKEPVGAGDIYRMDKASTKAIDFLMGMSAQYVRITAEMNATVPPASDYETGDCGYLSQTQFKEYEKDVTAAQTLKEIKVSGAKTTYEYGEPFSTAGMTVTAEYEYGNTKDVTDKAVVDTVTKLEPAGHANSKADQPEAREVSYAEGEITRTATVSLTVKNPVKSISVNAENAETDYVVGNTLSTNGLIVTATYKSDYSEPVTGYTNTTVDMSSKGSKTVTVTYEEKKATYTIMVYKSAPAKAVGTVSPGDAVTLGGEEWIVLKQESGKAELLKKKLLPEERGYQNGDRNTPNPGWTNSSIYTYLTGEYQSGLHSDITGMLVETRHDTNDVYPNHENMISSTEKVYLLSREEFDIYINSGVIDGKVTGDDLNNLTGNRWWLRSPSVRDSTYADTVFCSDGTRTYANVSTVYGIRPALTVNYE